MRAPTLRIPVEIEELSTRQDGDGSTIDSWAPALLVYAGIAPVAGREYFDAEKAQSEVTHRIQIRALPRFRPRPHHHRIRWGSRVFDLESVLDLDERGQWLMIMAREVSP